MDKQFARAIAESDLPAPEVLSRDKLWAAVDRYLAALAHCPTCQGEGTYVVGPGVYFDSDYGRQIEADRELPCPTCRGRGHDTAHSGWLCHAGPNSHGRCAAKNSPSEGHENCGQRISLPIPEMKLTQDDD